MAEKKRCFAVLTGGGDCPGLNAVIASVVKTFLNNGAEVYDELRSLIDLKIFVDVDADERILRRVKRDMEFRARSIDSVMSQYLTTVKPMHEKYVAPTKNYADIVITKGASNEVAINLLVNHIMATVK